MNAVQTKEKYVTRLERFFRFINIPGTDTQERCSAFADAAKKDNMWTQQYPPILASLQR
jgi:hypothetical protein